MSVAILGAHFDIHGGGVDLKFPHHENEIAQSCAATGEPFAEIWMHNGFVNVDDEKMSKSLGNFFTVRDVLAVVRHPQVLRYFLLASHYRGPINYSLEQLSQAKAALQRLYTALRDLPGAPVAESPFTVRFREVMDDDFNTPEAIAVLQTLAREINSARGAGDVARATTLAAELRSLAEVLGLLTVEPEEWFRLGEPAPAAGAAALASSAHEIAAVAAPSDADVTRLIEARVAARKAKDWVESDRIRDELAAAGVILEDRPGGRTSWRRT
jgi:cysteinyl-tRNA synthetase